MRLGVLGEPATEGEARHHRQGRQVNAAGVGGKWSFLPGEICSGVGCAVVVAAPTGPAVRSGSDRAEVSRGRSTGEGNGQSAGKDRTSSGSEESVLLVPVALIAAIPRQVGPSWEGPVNPGEYRGGA